MGTGTLFWAVFAAFILAMLALDLGVLNRRAHEAGLREALAWSAAWIGLALCFGAGLYLWYGTQPALEYLACYLLEKSLSVDNVFVFLLIFSALAVPRAFQHRVLFWGVLGALVMRGVFLVAGAELVHRAHAIFFVFGAILVVTALRLAYGSEKPVSPENNPAVRLLRQLVPLAADDRSGRFWIRRDGRLMATPLAVALVLIETTDLIFAVDSVPAMFGISDDLLVLYTSNIFAVMGLRALYFALGNVLGRFWAFRYGLAAVLTFVGAKLVMKGFGLDVPVGLALGVILGTLTLSMAVSWWWPRESPPSADATPSTREGDHTQEHHR